MDKKNAAVAKPHRRKGGGVAAAPRFDSIALLLQGGGSLGAYQGGVYQALTEAGLQPDWVAGISIGAINAAIIAGNPPERRVEQLRRFWDRITASPLAGWTDPWLLDGASLIGVGDAAHGMLGQLSAFNALVAGAPGFFQPRFPPPWFFPPGSPEATSFYDTAALKTTLESLVDFDRINSKAMRFSVGAVNVRTGNFVYFDTETDTIRPEHVLASGALPPGFPAIAIDGEYYWDGGLVSNTPLQWVVDSEPRRDTLAFQVDLWSSRGAFPRDMSEVAVRQKEIQYSSRTRASTDRLKNMQKIRAALAKLLDELPAALRATDDAKTLTAFADPKVYNVVQLIYRSKHYEGNCKDYEFSRLSMADHWHAGRDDAARALLHKEIFERPEDVEGFRSFDFDGDDTAADRQAVPRRTGTRS
jgi:NTE family protein